MLDVVLALAVLASVGGTIALALKLSSALDARNALREALDETAKERDSLKLKSETFASANVDLGLRLTMAETRANQAAVDALMHARNELDKADMPEAVRLVTDIFAKARENAGAK